MMASPRTTKLRDLPAAIAMLVPSAVVLGLFVLYPLVRAVQLGTQRCDTAGTRCRSTGWSQYVDLFRSVDFQSALLNTFQFALIAVPLGLVLGVVLAGIANTNLPAIGLFRTVFSSTVATSVAVASLMWLFLLQPSVGVLSNLNWLTETFGVLKTPGLLADPGTALWSVALSSVWANLGFTFIVVTAALQSIPEDLHEAAAIDGAGATRRFWSISIPLLRPTLVFVVVVLTTRAFQAYGEIDLLTEGGPRPGNETTTLTYLTYGQHSLLASDQGLRATSAVLLFVVLLILTMAQLWLLGRNADRGR